MSPNALRSEWRPCAFDGTRMVASSGAYPFEIRMNGRRMACAGVTAVATDPGYRRRWLVRNMVWIAGPEDDPAPQLRNEPRVLGRRTSDGIWMRVIDAEAALAARGYDHVGDLNPIALASLLWGYSSASLLVWAGIARANGTERLPLLDAFFSTRFRPTCANDS